MVGVAALVKDLLLGSESPKCGAAVEEFVELGSEPGEKGMSFDELCQCIESLHNGLHSCEQRS